MQEIKTAAGKPFKNTKGLFSAVKAKGFKKEEVEIKKVEGGIVGIVKDKEPEVVADENGNWPGTIIPFYIPKDKHIEFLTLLVKNNQSLGIEGSQPFNDNETPKSNDTRCPRHTNIILRVDENCPKCLNTCKAEIERKKNGNTVLPCPQCNNQRWMRSGGTIRLTKPGHYICGNCKIEYNVKGEKSNLTGKADF